MSDISLGLPEGALATAEQALATLMDETDGMIFCLIATVDGFAVASKTAPGWDITIDRMAAMASSGHALGDSVAGELTDAACDNVIIDTNHLSIVFLDVPEADDPPLILGVAARKTASLGTVLFSANQCVKEIAESVTTVV